MNTKYPFLGDYEMPKSLEKVYEHLTSGDAGSLEIFVPQKGKGRIQSLLGEKAAEHLIPIFTMRNGGVIVAWNSGGESDLARMPIVWIDSEGEPNDVFAENIDVLISLLHYDLGSFYDVLKANRRHSKDPSIYKSATDKFPNDDFLESAAEEWEEDSDLGDFHLWLEDNSEISRELFPVERIVKSNQMFPKFQDFIDGQ